MAAPEGGVSINWAHAMDLDSPPAELEVVGSSSSPVTPHPTTALRGDADDACPADDGAAAEFRDYSDQELRKLAERWRGSSLLRTVPDGGAKMRRRLNLAKEELERRRRRVAGESKDDRVQRQTMQTNPTNGSGRDPYVFGNADEISNTITGRYRTTSRCTSPIKGYGQGVAFCKETNSFSQGKHVPLNKGGQVAKISASHQLKTRTLHQKSNPSGTKTALRRCTRDPQKNSTIYSKDTRKLLEEDVSFGVDSRWEHSKSKVSSHKFKQDVVLLDDDETESNKWEKSMIYYPSRNDPSAVSLNPSDMKCLEPEAYLESPVINFYMQYLKTSRPCGDFHMFSTYFYSKLEEALSTTDDCDLRFNRLRKWWSGVDIFKKGYIILPIHATMHWSLIIVCMPTKETEPGPVMLHLDSLGLHSSDKIFKTVESFIKAEWHHLQKDSSYDVPFSGAIWNHLSMNINREVAKVPRQLNEYDCGLFMLYYIDRFIREAPKRWTRQNHHMFGRKWFSPKDASGLREGIRVLLVDIFQSAREDDEASEPETYSDDSEGKEG
ncbi:hypothetical protein ACP4OV_025096 [Aristida adscensionis]